MPQHTIINVLLIDVAVVVAALAIVLALRRWQRKVWLREQEKTGRGFEVETRAGKGRPS